jgi:hypothetical protein
MGLQMLHLLVALSVLLGADTASKLLRVTSNSTDSTVAATIGDYHADGDAFGFPRYRLDSAVATRILYRSAKLGAWAITGSETSVVKHEAPIIVSITTAGSPQGLAFKYFSDGKWLLDESFAVIEVNNRLLSKARISETPLTLFVLLPLLHWFFVRATVKEKYVKRLSKQTTLLSFVYQYFFWTFGLCAQVTAADRDNQGADWRAIQFALAQRQHVCIISISITLIRSATKKHSFYNFTQGRKYSSKCIHTNDSMILLRYLTKFAHPT